MSVGILLSWLLTDVKLALLRLLKKTQKNILEMCIYNGFLENGQDLQQAMSSQYYGDVWLQIGFWSKNALALLPG